MSQRFSGLSRGMVGRTSSGVRPRFWYDMFLATRVLNIYTHMCSMLKVHSLSTDNRGMLFPSGYLLKFSRRVFIFSLFPSAGFLIYNNTMHSWLLTRRSCQCKWPINKIFCILCNEICLYNYCQKNVRNLFYFDFLVIFIFFENENGYVHIHCHHDILRFDSHYFQLEPSFLYFQEM